MAEKACRGAIETVFCYGGQYSMRQRICLCKAFMIISLNSFHPYIHNVFVLPPYKIKKCRN